MSRFTISAALAAQVLLALPMTADAHDSAAPPGAPHRWLPAEEWVYRHWVPFSEQDLTDALALKRGELEAYLYDDHHSLSELARRRGIEVGALADRLVAPWRERSDPGHVAVLRDRTLRVLTQGHLAQHVFFHVYHGVDVESVAPRLFGVSSERFAQRRRAGAAPDEIARVAGRSAADVRSRMTRLLSAEQAAGVRARQTPPAGASRMLSRQRSRLSCWTTRPLPRWDPGSPYGKQMIQHGEHPARWPSTPAERLGDEARVERVRRTLPRTCWRPPRRWTWSTRPTGRIASPLCTLPVRLGRVSSPEAARR